MTYFIYHLELLLISTALALFINIKILPAIHDKTNTTINNKNKKASDIFNDCETIEVKRKIERDKGSTYYINNKIVRAKDVSLLFADASIGSDSSSIVAQGQINHLINSKPEEKRIILEEASGITGLHARRHEAELKLKSADNNLLRLEDIIKTYKEQFKIWWKI